MTMTNIKDINHVALHVENVTISKDFYKNIMLFEELPRPDFDFDGAWFRLGTTQELHLLGHRTLPIHSGSRSNHFALSTDCMDEWVEHLTKTGATFKPPKQRPDGVRQVFITDPDGHNIELCEV